MGDQRELSDAERHALATPADAPMATHADMRAALDAAEARAVGDTPKGGNVRFAVPAGDTRQQMRNWLTNTKEGQSIYNTGDCLLVWANEGDLFASALHPASPLEAVTLAAAAKLPEVRALVDATRHMIDFSIPLAKQYDHETLRAALAPFTRKGE